MRVVVDPALSSFERHFCKMVTHILVDVIVSEESSKVSRSAVCVARGLGADAGQRKVAKTYVVHVSALVRARLSGLLGRQGLRR